MTSSRSSSAFITSGSSGCDAVRADHFARRDFDAQAPQPRWASEVNTMSRADRSIIVSAKKRPRILLCDAALALDELYLMLLRSIPAIVEAVTSCADMYVHKEQAYALVILVLPPKSSETTEAAHFVRHRWSSARILLLESEVAAIDDWLYDERIDPNLDPATVREAAIRLIAEEGHLFPA